MTSIQRCQNYLSLARINLRLDVLSYFVFSALYLCAIPIFQGVSNLEMADTASCLENFAAAIGIILIVPIFKPEEASEIYELIRSKSMASFKPYILRVVVQIALIFSLTMGFCEMLRYNLCIFPFYKYALGTFVSAVFLGSLGMFASSVSGSTIAGYMISMGYLIMNMITGNKYVHNFYIMSMKNNSFYEKYYLLLGSIILIIVSIVIKSRKTR